MRESVASIALIQQVRNGQRTWLAQWNKNWEKYSFVGGHKRPDESFRECAIREVCEELELRPDVEFFVADRPLAHLDYTAWSQSARQETAYTIQLFQVELKDDARQKVTADRRNRWLNEDEIRTKQCDDGDPVSETIELVLTRANLLPSETD